MFKKTLLAATIAVASTGAAAVDITTGSAPAVYGSEALVSGLVLNNASVLTLGTTALTLGAEYSVGDTIKITMSGASFDTKKTHQLRDTNTNVGSAGVTAGLLSATAGELLFRITAIDTTNGTTTIGETMALEITATAPALGAPVPVTLSSTTPGSKVTITAKAATSTGLSIDTAGASDVLAAGSVVTEHVVKVNPAMAAKIDVAKAREQFETAADAKFTVTYAADPTVTQANFPVDAITYKVNGSMTGFEASVATTDNDGTISSASLGGLTVAADLQSATVTNADFATTPLAASEVFTFAVDGTAADREVLNVGSYTVDVDLASGVKVASVTGLAAGGFSLNGSSAQYAYVPVNFNGAVTTQFEIGNKGKVDGEISLSAFDTDGNKYEATLEKKAEAGKLTKLSDADISTAFGLTKGTKLNLTIVVNAPKGDITYGAYSNRGTTGRMAINAIPSA